MCGNSIIATKPSGEYDISSNIFSIQNVLSLCVVYHCAIIGPLQTVLIDSCIEIRTIQSVSHNQGTDCRLKKHDYCFEIGIQLQ